MAKERVMEIPNLSQVKYIVRRHEEIRVAKEALQAGDLNSLESMAHKWKGNGATFGFPELGTLGEKLELAASEKRVDDVSQLVGEFESWLHHHPIPEQSS